MKMWGRLIGGCWSEPFPSLQILEKNKILLFLKRTEKSMITLPLKIMTSFNYQGQNIKTNVSLLQNAKAIRKKYIKLRSTEICRELKPHIYEKTKTNSFRTSRIFPLVLVLNHIGLKTSTSCEGHFPGLEWYFKGDYKWPFIDLPYVYFPDVFLSVPNSSEKEEEAFLKLNFIINNIIKTHYLWKIEVSPEYCSKLYRYWNCYKIEINKKSFWEKEEKLKQIEELETKKSEIVRIRNDFNEDINTLALGILFHFDRFPSESETHRFKEFYFLDEYGKGFLPLIMLTKLFGLGFQDILKNFIQPAKEPYSEVAFEFIDGFDFCLKIPQISGIDSEKLWQAWHYVYADGRYV